MPIRFSVEETPPLKRGDQSMWRHQSERVLALRIAAAAAMKGHAPMDGPLRLVVRVSAAGSEERPPQWLRRQSGDLDSMIAGVCDGLQAAHPRGFDEQPWSDQAPEVHPGRAIGFTDDSWIREIDAVMLPLAEDQQVRYEVELALIE